MLNNSAKSVLVLAVLAAAGCASVPERDALDDARLSVNAARNNPQVASYAPAELNQAIVTLRQADDLAARGGRGGDVQQLAMLANQRAALAQDAARARAEEAALAVQRRASEAQLTADLSRRQAESAQIQAAAAQRQAEEAQRLASSMQVRADAYPPAYDYRRRQDERLYEANVSYVRAVVGPPQQRCWVSREKVYDNGPAAGVNIPGAIIGGAIGGILGHQIGGGRGQDLATGIGVLGGAAVGANVGRSDGVVYTQNVQRCDYVPASARLNYWDVTYDFGGYEHRVQMMTPPGATILVNAQGEPRV